MLIVGFGGFVGAVARYKLGGIVLHHTAQEEFPWSTFAVNVSGCLLFGLLAGLAERHHVFTPHARLLLLTGLLGGFTTFSAFGYETFYLLRRGEVVVATANIFFSVFCCVVAVWFGSVLSTLGKA